MSVTYPKASTCIIPHSMCVFHVLKIITVLLSKEPSHAHPERTDPTDCYPLTNAKIAQTSQLVMSSYGQTVVYVLSSARLGTIQISLEKKLSVYVAHRTFHPITTPLVVLVGSDLPVP